MRSWDYLVSNLVILVVSFVILKKNMGVFNFFLCVYINQLYTIKEIYIFSNCHHLKWRVGLLDAILKGDHPSQIWFNLVLWFQKRRFNAKVYEWRTDSKWWEKLQKNLKSEYFNIFSGSFCEFVCWANLYPLGLFG